MLLLPLKGDVPANSAHVSSEDSDGESLGDIDEYWRIAMEDSDGDGDEYWTATMIKEYEKYMMRWELLGIDMHGLDAVEDYEPRWMPLALQDQDQLNSLFGFAI